MNASDIFGVNHCHCTIHPEERMYFMLATIQPKNFFMRIEH